MSDITRDTLMAYIDNQLDPAIRTRIEADPSAMAEIAALQRQSDAIRTLYQPAGAEPVPTRLDPHRLALNARRRRWQSMAQAAMIVAVLGVGIAVGWLLRPGNEATEPYDRLIADAVSAHTVYVAENRHAVEVASAEAEHLSSWLSNRLDTNLAMPDLSGQGLIFLGGRLLPAPAIPGGRAAQLMYEDDAGQRLTLYITPSTGVGGPDYETVSFGNDQVLYWTNAVFTCTIVGSETPEQLRAIASAVFAQLSPGSEPLYES